MMPMFSMSWDRRRDPDFCATRGPMSAYAPFHHISTSRHNASVVLDTSFEPHRHMLGDGVKLFFHRHRNTNGFSNQKSTRTNASSLMYNTAEAAAQKCGSNSD
jgi:hypothetical protein